MQIGSPCVTSLERALADGGPWDLTCIGAEQIAPINQADTMLLQGRCAPRTGLTAGDSRRASAFLTCINTAAAA